MNKNYIPLPKNEEEYIKCKNNFIKQIIEKCKELKIKVKVITKLTENIIGDNENLYVMISSYGTFCRDDGDVYNYIVAHDKLTTFGCLNMNMNAKNLVINLVNAKNNSGGECMICYDKNDDIEGYHACHLCNYLTCRVCTEKLRDCPQCRTCCKE